MEKARQQDQQRISNNEEGEEVKEGDSTHKSSITNPNPNTFPGCNQIGQWKGIYKIFVGRIRLISEIVFDSHQCVMIMTIDLILYYSTSQGITNP